LNHKGLKASMKLMLNYEENQKRLLSTYKFKIRELVCQSYEASIQNTP